MPHLLALPPEIIFSIFSYHTPDRRDKPKDSPRCLARLAQTCHYLWEPAIAVLWRTLPGFNPLLYTLPVDMFINDPKYDESDAELFHLIIRLRDPLELLRDLVPGDFDRWVVHAQFVCSIGPEYDAGREAPADSELHLRFASELWTALARGGPDPLLPALRRLSSYDTQVRFLSSASLPSFPLGPDLQSFSLWIDRQNTDLRGLLAKLAASLASSHLQVLVLQRKLRREYNTNVRVPAPSVAAARDARLAAPLAGCLRALSCLRRLHVEGIPLSPAGLSTIGSMPSLRNLWLSISSTDYPSDSQQTADAFPALETLHITTDDLSCATTLLPYVSSPHLYSFSLSTDSAVPYADLTNLFSALSTHPSHSTLQTLRLQSTRQRPHPPWDLSHALCPLLLLPHIVTFAMAGWAFLTVDDDTIAAIAHAWPALESLALDSFRDSRPPLSAVPEAEAAGTLPGLLPLAERCPRLVELRLAVSALGLEDEDEDVLSSCRAAAPARPPVLAERAAAFLGRHFPTLGLVHGCLWQMKWEPEDELVERFFCFWIVRR